MGLAIFVGTLIVPPFDMLFGPLYYHLFHVLFGWIGFLRRVVPEVRPDGPTVLLSLVALLGFVGLLHEFARWWRRERGGETEWRSAWSFGVTGGLALVFVTGTAMIGIVHQAGWMLTDDTPWWYTPHRPARRSASKSNLKQIAVAFHNHHDVHGSLPPGMTLDATGRPMHSWATALLPMIERDDLYEAIDHGRAWDDPANTEAMQTRLNAYLNPGVRSEPVDERGYAVIHYAGNARLLGSGPARRFRDVSDGLSNTILAGEVNADFVAWGNPLNVRDPALGVNRSPRGFGAPWKGGAHILMADGWVRFVNDDIDPSVMRALATPDGGEEVEVP